MNISISFQGLEQLDRARESLSNKQLNKAVKSALVFAGKAVPPTVAKGIGQSYAIKAARIKQDISNVSVAPGGDSVTIRFSRRPPTLIQYSARPGTRGTGQRGLGRGKGWTAPRRPGKPVTAVVLRTKGRSPYRGAFITSGLNGNTLALKRRGRKLTAVYGPSIGSIFGGRSEIGDQLRADTASRVRERFAKGLERSMDAATRGYARGRSQ